MATTQTPCSLRSNVEPPTPTTTRTRRHPRSILMAGFGYFLGKSFFNIFLYRPLRKCPFVTWEGSQGEARTEVAPADLLFWTFYDQKSLWLPGPWLFRGFGCGQGFLGTLKHWGLRLIKKGGGLCRCRRMAVAHNPVKHRPPPRRGIDHTAPIVVAGCVQNMF
jgi:hypothetical protein